VLQIDQTVLDANVCSIALKWNDIMYERMKKALNMFRSQNVICMSPTIHETLLGRSTDTQIEWDENVSAPNLHPLNEYQQQAVLNALTRPFSIIQGPPGEKSSYFGESKLKRHRHGKNRMRGDNLVQLSQQRRTERRYGQRPTTRAHDGRFKHIRRRHVR
jgi:hypothetical protein